MGAGGLQFGGGLLDKLQVLLAIVLLRRELLFQLDWIIGCVLPLQIYLPPINFGFLRSVGHSHQILLVDLRRPFSQLDDFFAIARPFLFLQTLYSILKAKFLLPETVVLYLKVMQPAVDAVLFNRGFLPAVIACLCKGKVFGLFEGSIGEVCPGVCLFGRPVGRRHGLEGEDWQ